MSWLPGYTHPLIKVTETDREVVFINANHIREVQQYGPPERQPPRGS